MTHIEEQIRALVLCQVAETDEEKRAAKEKLLKAMSQPDVRPPVEDAETIIRKVLLDLGVPCHVKGYTHLVTALGLVVEEPVYIEVITKGLYPAVAEAHETTPSRVERAIRHAIEIAWDRCCLDTLTEYFGNTVSLTKGKPTNSEFIALVANVVRQRLKEANK